MIELVLRSVIRVVAMTALFLMFPFMLIIGLLEKLYEAAADKPLDKGIDKTGLRND